jgi:predicted nucleotidyltransferase
MYKVDWDNISRILADVPQVMAAWGFGSGQNGIILPGSDLDIGILWSELPTLERLADLRSDLQATLRVAFVSLTAREYEDSMAMIQRALVARATFESALKDPHPNPLPEGEGTLGK